MGGMRMKKVKMIATLLAFGIIIFGFALWTWFGPDREFSSDERRYLAEFPELSTETLLSGDFMADFEGYTQDQFPLRDSFRGLKAFFATKVAGKKDNNGLYSVDGQLSKIEYPMSESMIDHAADRFTAVYDRYLKDSGGEVFLTVVPDKGAYLAEENGYLSMDYPAFYEKVQETLPYMTYLPVEDLLGAEDYYKTDSHWRQESILDVAQRLAEKLGGDPLPEFERETLTEPFYGVYAGQSATGAEPDQITYLTNDILEGVKVTGLSDLGVWEEKALYDRKELSGVDPYTFFLSGTEALLTIENPMAENDKEIIVFRDSFGSSLIPLMVPGFSKITLVDLRYIRGDQLGNYVEFDGQDVLFLYSTTLFNNSLAIG